MHRQSPVKSTNKQELEPAVEANDVQKEPNIFGVSLKKAPPPKVYVEQKLTIEAITLRNAESRAITTFARKDELDKIKSDMAGASEEERANRIQSHLELVKKLLLVQELTAGQEWIVENNTIIFRHYSKHPSPVAEKKFFEQLVLKLNKKFVEMAQGAKPIKLDVVTAFGRVDRNERGGYVEASLEYSLESGCTFSSLLALAHYEERRSKELSMVVADVQESPAASSSLSSEVMDDEDDSNMELPLPPLPPTATSMPTPPPLERGNQTDYASQAGFSRGSFSAGKSESDPIHDDTTDDDLSSSRKSSSVVSALSSTRSSLQDVDLSAPPLTVEKKDAKDLAKFVSDGRLGNPGAPKKDVKNAKEVKCEINRMIESKHLQSADEKALATLTLLDETYYSIYGKEHNPDKNKTAGGRALKELTFTRKNDSYFLPRFFNRNTSATKAERSGTEQTQMGLLKSIYLDNWKALAKSTAYQDKLDVLEGFINNSKLLAFHTSYYECRATGDTSEVKEARKILQQLTNRKGMKKSQ